MLMYLMALATVAIYRTEKLKKSDDSIDKTLYCTFAIYTLPLTITQEEHKSTWEPIKYGKFVSQF